MQVGRLDDMVKGWFVGRFAPTMFATDAAEVAVKRYAAGDDETWHYHQVATEITLILSGAATMDGQRCDAGTIIRLEPGEGAAFHALEDTVTVVVKVPCVPGDKFTGRPPRP